MTIMQTSMPLWLVGGTLTTKWANAFLAMALGAIGIDHGRNWH
jgi:hypothetical protein